MLGVERYGERDSNIFEKLFDPEYRVMERRTVVKCRELVHEAAHEPDVIHRLLPVVKFLYFRVLCFYNLERRRDQSQRVPYLMGNHRHICMVVFQKPGDDLTGVCVFFHQVVHFVDIYIIKHEKFPHFRINGGYLLHSSV